MKTIKIIYWIATPIVSAGLLMGGSQMLMHSAQMTAQFEKMGYPEFLISFLGIAKVSAALALLQPWLPRLKEWAYAGVTFLLIGAVWSHLAADDAPGSMGAMIVLVVLTVSYVLFRRMQVTNPQLIVGMS